MATNRISGGKFRSFDGTVLANGYLVMELSHDERDTTDLAQVVGGFKIHVPLDNNGSVAGTVNVEVNSSLLPAGSYYVVNAYRNDGTKAWKAAQFVQVPASPNPYDIGNWIPTNPPGVSFSGGGGGTSISLQTNGTPNTIQTIENLIAGANVVLTADGVGGTTIAATGGGGGVILQTNGVSNATQSTLNLVAGTNVTLAAGLSGDVTINSSGGGGSANGYLTLENGITDQTGNSVYSALSLTSWFVGHWEFVTNQSSYVTFSMRLPASVPSSANIILEIFSNDATAGHTANFQTSDAVINTGTMNIGSLTSAASQTYTTTTTAYARTTLTFAVQSALVSNGILVIKVATAPTGTQPTANICVLPYLKLVP